MRKVWEEDEEDGTPAGDPELDNEDCKQSRRRGVPVLAGTNSSFPLILSEKLGEGETFLGVNSKQTAALIP